MLLRAELDCVVAFSACPQDLVPINGVACQPTEVHIELVCTLICAVDGSVVSALVEGRDPRAAAQGAVVDLIEVLAPIDQRPVQI